MISLYWVWDVFGELNAYFGRSMVSTVQPLATVVVILKIPPIKRSVQDKPGMLEVVKIVFDPSVVSLEQLLSLFWEKHNPTQGMRQGNDIGLNTVR